MSNDFTICKVGFVLYSAFLNKAYYFSLFAKIKDINVTEQFFNGVDVRHHAVEGYLSDSVCNTLLIEKSDI